MSFQLISNPEAEAIALAQSLAVDAVQVASQFDSEILAQYRAMYKNYWTIDREFTVEQLQARSDRMGPTELAILLKAGVFVTAMLQIGAPLESKYHSPPYEYSIVDVAFADGHQVAAISTFEQLYALMVQHGQFISGKLLLGDKRSEWTTPTNDQ